MTKLQRLNLINCTRESFTARLNELRRVQISLNSELWRNTKLREDALRQAVRFCDYIRITIIHGSEPGPETKQMLHYIGLDELVNAEWTQPGEREVLDE